MFLKYNNITDIDRHIGGMYRLVRRNLFKDLQKIWKKEAIQGDATYNQVSYHLLPTMYFTLMKIESKYTPVKQLYVKYDINTIKKCLACRNIRIKDYLSILNLPTEEEIFGIGDLDIGRKFQVNDRDRVQDPALSNCYNIKDLLEAQDYCIVLTPMDPCEIIDSPISDDDSFRYIGNMEIEDTFKIPNI